MDLETQMQRLTLAARREIITRDIERLEPEVENLRTQLLQLGAELMMRPQQLFWNRAMYPGETFDHFISTRGPIVLQLYTLLNEYSRLTVLYTQQNNLLITRRQQMEAESGGGDTPRLPSTTTTTTTP